MSETIGCVSREKYWKELTTDAEKIERLRSVLHRIESRLDRVASQSNTAHSVAHRHQHAANGAVLIAAEFSHGNESEPGRRIGSADEAYY